MATGTTSGWVKVALGLSLALNVFFLGLTGGSLFQGKPEGRDTAPNSFLATLSDERKAEVQAVFDRMREDRQAARQTTRASWVKVREAMTAVPYDRAAMEAAMKGVIDARTERSEKRYGQMVEFVSTMTDAERKAFAEAMRERWQRRRARREDS